LRPRLLPQATGHYIDVLAGLVKKIFDFIGFSGRGRSRGAAADRNILCHGPAGGVIGHNMWAALKNDGRGRKPPAPAGHGRDVFPVLTKRRGNCYLPVTPFAAPVTAVLGARFRGPFPCCRRHEECRHPPEQALFFVSALLVLNRKFRLFKTVLCVFRKLSRKTWLYDPNASIRESLTTARSI